MSLEQTLIDERSDTLQGVDLSLDPRLLAQGFQSSAELQAVRP